MKVVKLQRVFKFNGVTLPDPGVQHDPNTVKALYSATYPDLTTAVIEGPNEIGGKLVYEFRKAVGTKG
jgi:PRTRC genetic system protein C